MVRCVKGKKCGRTCIQRRKRCTIQPARRRRAAPRRVGRVTPLKDGNKTSIGAIMKCRNMTANAQREHFRSRPPPGYRNAIIRDNGQCTPVIIRR